jgi:hypothetical protein
MSDLRDKYKIGRVGESEGVSDIIAPRSKLNGKIKLNGKMQD